MSMMLKVKILFCKNTETLFEETYGNTILNNNTFFFVIIN